MCTCVLPFPFHLSVVVLSSYSVCLNYIYSFFLNQSCQRSVLLIPENIFGTLSIALFFSTLLISALVNISLFLVCSVALFQILLLIAHFIYYSRSCFLINVSKAVNFPETFEGAHRSDTRCSLQLCYSLNPFMIFSVTQRLFGSILFSFLTEGIVWFCVSQQLLNVFIINLLPRT